METKILIWAGYLVGVPAYVSAFWLNIGTWKSDLLLVIAVLFACFKLYFYVRRELDRMKMRNLELKERIRRLEDQDFFRNQY